MTPVERVIRNLLTDYRYGNKTTDDVVEMLVDIINHTTCKVEFLKSANEPSEITHPYDLSKK